MFNNKQIKKEKPIRIAQIMGKWLGGGVEAVIMNYYRHMDRSQIQFDFICDNDSTDIPYEEIESLGGKVILIPPYQHIFKYHRELKIILKNNNYKIVHSHINTLSIFSLFAAKKANVPIRIAHSHSTTNKKEWKKNILKQVLRPFNKIFATNYMACSEIAGRWMFGNKEFNKGNVFILNNAIEIEKFQYDENKKIKIRKELNISDKDIVIGHIGRFVESKNHLFIIDVFNEYHKENKNSKLLLIGKGPALENVKSKIKTLKLEDAVIFLGQKNDIYNYYNTMDLFIFPSLYEGLGMVLIEAQINKLPCLASSKVPEITKISNGIKYISLKKGKLYWNEQLKQSLNIKRNIQYNDNIELYNIKTQKRKLEKKYMDLIKN